MGDSITITVSGGDFSCEAKQGETVFAALVRAGLPMSAPCGGRGICGNCSLTLLKGKVETPGKKIKLKQSFCACRTTALTDIKVALPEGEITGWPLSVMSKKKKKNAKKTTDDKKRRLGLGLDMGTTTIQAELIDLDTGITLETISVLNDQRSFGADVMSRIATARNGRSFEISAIINRQIEDILRRCLETRSHSKIEQCTISGNTAMLHFFAREDTSAMGEAPYTPVFLEEKHFKGKDLSLSAENITLLPGISAFVGADIVSGLAYLDIMDKKEDALFIDIGTNGEIALWKDGEKKLLCCSTAAGPCFEGAEISCGMGAVPGALNRISLKKGHDALNWNKFGSLYYTVIGGVHTRGICGAGLIDAIAVMKELEVFDETGALLKDFKRDGFPVTLELSITQKDIRQFQLAKSAIYSGIEILCATAGFKVSDLHAAYIAGGLGFFINLENSAAVKLLPSELISKTAVCGNTSLRGAVKSLTDSSFLPRCREIVSHSTTVDLALDGSFSDTFAENMTF
jgi:uncharacterized 2Fe-2S/4Fe-4S cluster protein (DUF4445 family)